MPWNTVIAQEHIKHQLQEMVSHNRLSHALLFVGKEGSGALPLAIEFAKHIVTLPKAAPVVEDLFGGMSAMNSSTDEVELDAAKQRAEQLIHPDLHLSFPVITKKSGEKPTSKDYIIVFREFIKINPYANVYDWLQEIDAENKQGNITAEECNDIIKKLSLKSYESEYKVLVMWMPEYLGKEGNKLLKLIEEPPANTIFILVAESEENILPTIISRCQMVKIPMLQIADVEKALVERCNVEPVTARQIASISEGNYREALQLLQHNEEDWIELLASWLKFVTRRMLPEQLKWVDEVSKLGREKQKQFLRYFNHLLEQAVKLRMLGEQSMTLPVNELEFAKKLNIAAKSVEQQEAIINELDNAMYYIERNANSKILFQALSIKLFKILKGNSVVEIV